MLGKGIRRRDARTLILALALAFVAILFTACPAPALTVGKAVPLEPSGTVNTLRPTFHWKRAKNATYYRVKVYKDGSFLFRTKWLKHTEWTCTRDLPKNANLSWRVRAAHVFLEGGMFETWGPYSLSSTMRFTVLVGSDQKAVTSFSFQGLSPPEYGTIDPTAHTIALTVPFGTNVHRLTPTIVVSGVSVSPASGVEQDFFNPVTYTVTAENGTTQDWTATVSVRPNTAKQILSFDFLGLSPPVTGAIDQTLHQIDLSVPQGTDVTALVATFTSSPGSTVAVDGVTQISGVSPVNFSNPVAYTVTAADGSTQVYAVRVHVQASSDKAITSFRFDRLAPPVTGVIDPTLFTIALTVPAGTNRGSLVATFVTTGTSVTVDGVPQVSGVTARDFNRPVTYVVHAADGSTQAYVVTVNLAASSAKEITTFDFRDLSPVVVGTVDPAARTIALTVPYGTRLTDLVASFTTTGVSVSVDGTPQVSGVTPNDFSSPVTYTVAAEDGSTVNYVATVTVADRVPAVIDSVNPTYGYVGTEVTLTGSGFGNGTVLFGTTNPITHVFTGWPATVVSRSDTRIVCTVPQLSAGVKGICIKQTYFEGTGYRMYYSNIVSFTVYDPPV